MILMLYGPSCCGKTTLMKMLAEYKYTPVPTGNLTRSLYAIGCTNMPVIMQTVVQHMQPGNYCFDHFYIHTMEQLHDLTGEWPVVIGVLDKRTNPTRHSQDPTKIQQKQERFNAQAPEIAEWLRIHPVKFVFVINTDYGFDLSELIEHRIIPYNALVMKRP